MDSNEILEATNWRTCLNLKQWQDWVLFSLKLTYKCWQGIQGEKAKNERSGPHRHTISVIDNSPDSDIPVIWFPVQEDKTSNQTQHYQRPLYRTRSDKLRPRSVQAARMIMRHGHHSSMCSSTHDGHIHDVSRQDYEGGRQCSLDPLSQWFPTFSSQQLPQTVSLRILEKKKLCHYLTLLFKKCFTNISSKFKVIHNKLGTKFLIV